MDLRQTQASAVMKAPYDEIGGAEAVERLVNGFYDRIEEAYPLLRDMLPNNTTVTRRKLIEFLTGWLGGPQLYIEKYGHPRLRMRHFPFKVDTEAARQWLEAMYASLDDLELEERVDTFIRARFLQTAAHMRNVDDEVAVPSD